VSDTPDQTGGWKVQLTGHEFDLEEFPLWLEGASVRVLRENGEFHLAATCFGELDGAADVLRAAREILDLLNGLGRLNEPSFHHIGVGSVHRSFPDGRTEQYLFASEGIRARGKCHPLIVSAEGQPQPDPRAGVLTPLLHKAVASEPMQRALGFLSRAQLTWNDLYRAMEVVESTVGGEMFAKGWLTKAQQERFNRTANSYSVLGADARHGRDRHEPPANPVSFEEAKQIVFSVVLRWLKAAADAPLANQRSTAESSRGANGGDKHPLARGGAGVENLL
jgi:hypothetical protein